MQCLLLVVLVLVFWLAVLALLSLAVLNFNVIIDQMGHLIGNGVSLISGH